MQKETGSIRKISYSAPLITNIRQILTGLQGFDSMAREIIQNADDAGARHIRFDVTDVALVVWNDAEFLSCGLNSDECTWTTDRSLQLGKRKACDFHAISKVGSGNKYNQTGLIGRFGIGFVSVYQLTDQPIIRSGDIELTLDPLHEENQIRTIDRVDGAEITITWALDDLSPIREALSASAFSLESIKALQADLINTAEESLLFLKNLCSIEILRNGKRASFVQKTAKDENHLELFFERKNKYEKWYVIHLDAEEAARPLKEKFVAIDRLDRQTAVQIAFRIDDHKERSGRLFAYLPTEEEAPVPCHINADFFPEQTRKALVLSGEQHERYWNEMLLKYVAQEIAGRLESLKHVLGPKGLWKLIDEAYQHRKDYLFKVFWEEILKAAKDANIYLTSAKEWAYRSDCTLLSAEYQAEQEASLEKIGVSIVHSSLRAFKSVIRETGVTNLDLKKLLDALKLWDQAEFNSHLEPDWVSLYDIISPIWRILEDLLEHAKNYGPEFGLRRLKEELQELRIAPRFDGRLVNLSELRRLPPQVKVEDVQIFFPELPLASEELVKFPQLFSLANEFVFEDVLCELAERVKDAETAMSFMSLDKERVRAFYDFLVEYPRDETYDYSSVAASTPFLAGHGRFLTPELAVLPGGFDDPIGRFDTLDLDYFGDKARKFIREVLKVKTLTLQTYIEEHLADILEEGLSNEQYVALLEVFLSKKDLLDKEDTRRTLAALPLVRSKDGLLRPSKECYTKTDALAEILGDDDALWVDESIFGEKRRELYLGFFRSLGMRSSPSLAHALDRIEAIVENLPSVETRGAISKIFGFLFEFYQSERLAENEDQFEDEISRMRYTDWLPAEIEGRLDTGSWYAPNEIFQPFRAGGFSSQVAVLAVGRRLNREFLEFLEMPAEPDTAIIVDHLEDCIERGIEPSKFSYQILNERLKKGDDQSSIDRLKNKKCIYAPAKKEFISADRFFWSKPHLYGFCFKATESMHEHKELFDFLGVAEEPSTETYVDVLIEIADKFSRDRSPLPGEIALVHDACTKILSEKLRDDPADTSHHLERLREYPFLLTLAATLAFVEEVAVQDSDWLVEPFGEELDARLVRPSAEKIELINWFNVKPLSLVTRLEIVKVGDVIDDQDSTRLLKERSNLLGWLCVDLRRETQIRLEKTLRNIELVRTDKLTARSIFELDDVPIKSAPRNYEVVFNSDEGRVYVVQDLTGNYWIPAFRAIFSTLLAGESKASISQLALIAKLVLSATSLENAANELRQAGYDTLQTDDIPIEEPFEDEVGELDFGTELISGMADWDVAEGEVIDEVDGGNDTAASDIHIAEEAKKGAGSNASSRQVDPVLNKNDGLSRPSTRKTSSSNSVSAPKEADNEKPNRKARTEWMRSYVKPKQDEARDDQRGSGPSRERISAIDEAAMKAVLDYEQNRDFIPDRQPHYNPGYDVLSRSRKSNEKRLIEVKGLEGEWTERGVKLSKTQISFAQDNPDEAWLYVVENALEPKKRKINAIKNPFSKADEFWFDRVWREVAEEKSVDYKAQFLAGRRIQVEGLGEGTILNKKNIGVTTQLTIEFNDERTRTITFNATTMELLED